MVKLPQHDHTVNKVEQKGGDNDELTEDKCTEAYIKQVRNDDGATESMQANYDLFWQLLLGRIFVDKSPDP